MKKVMQDNGYYKSKITGAETPVPDRQQMNITFHVAPAPRRASARSSWKGGAS